MLAFISVAVIVFQASIILPLEYMFLPIDVFSSVTSSIYGRYLVIHI